mmetsp:Transcript_9778/g.24366  ORF Transcript_9778/g.24366 Transcript_9778/m.24366 type:complete len:221 (+) Transcript_9778:1399-2061(+)
MSAGLLLSPLASSLLDITHMTADLCPTDEHQMNAAQPSPSSCQLSAQGLSSWLRRRRLLALQAVHHGEPAGWLDLGPVATAAAAHVVGLALHDVQVVVQVVHQARHERVQPLPGLVLGRDVGAREAPALLELDHHLSSARHLPPARSVSLGLQLVLLINPHQEGAPQVGVGRAVGDRTASQCGDDDAPLAAHARQHLGLLRHQRGSPQLGQQLRLLLSGP